MLKAILKRTLLIYICFMGVVFVLALASAHRVISPRSLMFVLLAVCVGMGVSVVLVAMKTIKRSVYSDASMGQASHTKLDRTAPQEFHTVWYRPHANKWREIGILKVHDHSLEFRGVKKTVVIENIQRISYGKQGMDFINYWVKVEYRDSETLSVAFFADGSSHGWGGIYGGTERIHAAVKACLDHR